LHSKRLKKSKLRTAVSAARAAGIPNKRGSCTEGEEEKVGTPDHYRKGGNSGKKKKRLGDKQPSAVDAGKGRNEKKTKKKKERRAWLVASRKGRRRSGYRRGGKKKGDKGRVQTQEKKNRKKSKQNPLGATK